MTRRLPLRDDQQRAIVPLIEELQARLPVLRDEQSGRRQRRREARAIFAGHEYARHVRCKVRQWAPEF